MSEANEAREEADPQLADALAFLSGSSEAKPEAEPDTAQAEEAKEAPEAATEEPEQPDQADEGKPAVKEEGEYDWATDESVRADLSAAGLKPETVAWLKNLSAAEKNYARGFHKKQRELNEALAEAKEVSHKAAEFDRLMGEETLQRAFLKAKELIESQDTEEFDEDLATPEERRAHRLREQEKVARKVLEEKEQESEPLRRAEAIKADLEDYASELAEEQGLTAEDFNKACFATIERIKSLGLDPKTAITLDNARAWLADDVSRLLTEKRLKELEDKRQASKATAARAVRATTPPPSGPASAKNPPAYKVAGRKPTRDDLHAETMEQLRAAGIDLSQL